MELLHQREYLLSMFINTANQLSKSALPILYLVLWIGFFFIMSSLTPSKSEELAALNQKPMKDNFINLILSSHCMQEHNVSFSAYLTPYPNAHRTNEICFLNTNAKFGIKEKNTKK